MIQSVDNYSSVCYFDEGKEVSFRPNLDNVIDCEHEATLPRVMTVKEMAMYLRVSLPTAYELVKSRGFPAFKIGRRTLISERGLQDWIANQCKGGRNNVW